MRFSGWSPSTPDAAFRENVETPDASFRAAQLPRRRDLLGGHVGGGVHDGDEPTASTTEGAGIQGAEQLN
jgi:hypothetical protein